MKQRNKWEKLYEAAILETDNSKLKERIDAALAAIEVCLREFGQNRTGTPKERQALREALKGLAVLREKAPPR